MMEPFKSGTHALVTGGTSGIGRAIAAGLHEAGCTVTVTAVDAAAADRARGASETRGVAVAMLDVSDSEAVSQLAKTLPRLDILVNCAGMILRGGAEFDLANFAKVVEVNLTGAMRVSTACRSLLAARGGSILNIASMLSFFGGGHAPAYSASKGGIVQLTRSLALAWAGEGIRVNAVAPGWIETEMTRPLRQDEERSRKILDRTPLRRWGRPEDVAGPAIFLCSPAAAFITGAVLPVDGGYSAA